MGWNTPDDCPWPSDLDYYEAMRGPMDREERDEDEDREPLCCCNDQVRCQACECCVQRQELTGSYEMRYPITKETD